MNASQRSFTVDAALIATILSWAVNFSVIKLVFENLDPLAFNTVRLVGASVLFLGLARLTPGASVLPEDWVRLVVLALVGHTAYQFLFIFGIDETTASNSAILLGLTPVFVAILSNLFSIERTGFRVWVGIATSVLGVYLVLDGSGVVGGSARGDWLTLGAALCWSVYTVVGQPVVARYGLFRTNAYSIAIGTLFFLPFGVPALLEISPATVPASAWWGTGFSLVFALVVAYSGWYYAVSRIGPTQTSVYSNLMPVAAVAIAHYWLDEPVAALQLGGAAIIFLGIYLVRRGKRTLDPEG